MNLNHREILIFRCHEPPLIGVKPQKAYAQRDNPGMYAEMTDIGVYVKWRDGSEHVVPFTNIEYLRLAPYDGPDEPIEPKIKKGKISEK